MVDHRREARQHFGGFRHKCRRDDLCQRIQGLAGGAQGYSYGYNYIRRWLRSHRSTTKAWTTYVQTNITALVTPPPHPILRCLASPLHVRHAPLPVSPLCWCFMWGESIQLLLQSRQRNRSYIITQTLVQLDDYNLDITQGSPKRHETLARTHIFHRKNNYPDMVTTALQTRIHLLRYFVIHYIVKEESKLVIPAGRCLKTCPTRTISLWTIVII